MATNDALDAADTMAKAKEGDGYHAFLLATFDRTFLRATFHRIFLVAIFPFWTEDFFQISMVVAFFVYDDQYKLDDEASVGPSFYVATAMVNAKCFFGALGNALNRHHPDSLVVI